MKTSKSDSEPTGTYLSTLVEVRDNAQELPCEIICVLSRPRSQRPGKITTKQGSSSYYACGAARYDRRVVRLTSLIHSLFLIFPSAGSWHACSYGTRLI